MGNHIGGYMGFPEIRGTLFGVPILRVIVFGDIFWGPPI